jgi:glycosyltransferase involved in cell wall biosynthesis
MKPDISVIIPTWRRPALLERCLKALIHQSFDKSRYEIIVVTDGPDIRSMACVEQLQKEVYECPEIHCISLAVKKGPAAARNAGWMSARGELILFTDDDCIPLFGFVESYWNTYAGHQRSAMAFAGKVQVPVSEPPSDYEKNISLLEQASFVTANCACTWTALAAVRGLDEDFTMAWREDSALEFDLINRNIPIIPVPNAIVVHPVRKASWGVSIPEQKKSMFNPLLYKKHPVLYKNKINNKPPWYYYAMVVLLITAVVTIFLDHRVMLAALGSWLFLVGWFTWKRLKNTSKSLPHVLEMIYTSAIIPFLSIFWHLYGAVKFKSFYL